MGYKVLGFVNAAEAVGSLVAVAGIAPEPIASPRELYSMSSKPEPVKDDP